MSYAAYCLHAALEGVLRSDKLLEDPVGFMPERLDSLDQDLAKIAANRERALLEKAK